MAVFFTADTHFGHKGVLRLMNRPFDTVSAMDEALTAAWNARVSPEDTVYHLGDFCFKGSKLAAAAADKLNGEIVLLRGNHDTANTMALPRWRETADILELTLERRRLVLCHYPMLEWPGAFRGALHLHGHTHGRVPPNAARIDVGVDSWGFQPVTLAEIVLRLDTAPPYDPTDSYGAEAAPPQDDTAAS